MLEKKEIKEYIKKSTPTILVIIFFLLLAFGERLISTSFSIDTEIYLGNYSAPSWWLALNRWGLILINKVLGMGPLIIFQSNFITIILIACYSLLYCYLFYLYIPEKWKKNYLKYQFILPIVFITNPIFAEQYNFINQNVGVSLGICFIAISLILMKYADDIKGSKKIMVNSIAIVLSVFTFGIYQSMIPLYILVIACTYFLECINKKNSSWKFLLDRIIKFTIISIIYFIICKIVGGENSYLQSAWSTTGLGCIKNIYYVIIDMIKCNTIFYNISFLIAIVIMILVNVYLIIKKKTNFGILLSSLGILMAPFYIMIITGVDQLKRTQFNYSFVIGFILLIGCMYLIINKKQKIFRYFIVILSLAISYKQANITGKLFASDNVRFQTDTILATKIQSEIEKKDWYEENKKYTLIILGKKENSSNIIYEKGEVIGHSFFEFDYQYYYGPSQRANAFMKTLGYNYNEPTDEEFKEAKKATKENRIESYPSDESIYLKNEKTIIVRLSKEV